MSYLESIGAGLDFLEDLNDMSPDPMNDPTDETFYHPISLSPIPKGRAAPIYTWEIDWSKPLPETAHAYWETMHVNWNLLPLLYFCSTGPFMNLRRRNPSPEPSI
jgi:hypothetical protein